VSARRYAVLGIAISIVAAVAMVLLVPPCGFPDVSCR
jgi:hypothetical protein